ncbi:hypothetical protein GOP47_0009896 [Adiantum capillus-veneris]|uniref:Protein ENHANCED DISEASE RESISTANCE 2 C-terminal domain-containing protein n=1 Tax=Adiantum capillus-veneris TaxID=13818 RepID=A0A9D4ZK46_ADICA|nr:hypothetical protein GOP47_0009896 [Adiantum capillus-veneris]
MEASAAEIPAEHREWVERLRQGGQTPLSLHSAPNSWACPLPHVFSVRSADYLTSKAKIPASDYLLQPLAFDFLQGPSPITHIMNHPHSRVRTALEAAVAVRCDGKSPQHQPFVWAFNFQVGNKTHHSVVFYFVSFTSPPQGSLMQTFLDGDDAFRNARLKVLTHYPGAPWLVQVVLGKMSVGMVGKLVKCTYTREQHYIEVDADMGSSILTRTAVNLTFGLAPLIVADMGFVLEGIHPNELPERILGAMRLVKLKPSSATHVD